MPLRIALPTLLLALLPAAPASAHVCADFPNQAAAQRAADTRDADHDGVFCEALRCPCLRPRGTTRRPPARRRIASHALGSSLTETPVTRSSACRRRGALPDRACTPGARYSRATRTDVCTPGFAPRVRNVSQHTKDVVYAAYGQRGHFHPLEGEVDHLIPLELGGSNSRANLWPEPSANPGALQKDELEDRLHGLVCGGRMRLRTAQRLIAHDWVAGYLKYAA